MPISNTEILKSYKVLQLDLDASLDDVRKAFRNMVKIWHPDLYTGSPHIREMAEEKLKAINAAYDAVKSYLGSRKNIAPRQKDNRTASYSFQKNPPPSSQNSCGVSRVFSEPLSWLRNRGLKRALREYMKNKRDENRPLNSCHYRTNPDPVIDRSCHGKDFKQVLEEVAAAKLRSREPGQNTFWQPL